jgi:hypothetical protein
MTSLLDRNSTRADNRGPTGPERLVPTRQRNKRPLFAVASAVVVLVSIAAFMTLYSSARREQQVLVVAQTIEKGQTLSMAELGQASVNMTGNVEPIPVSLAGSVTGRRAAVTIPAGSLLVPADITSAPVIPQGYAVVGVALKYGQYPSTGLQSGDHVIVVQTASPGSPLPTAAGSGPSSQSPNSAATPSTGVLVADATVFDAASAGANGGSAVSELVSVEIPTTLAAAVSTAAAADQVSLVVLPDPGRATANGGSTTTGGNSS